MYRVALACEGPADRILIEAILDRYLGDYVLDLLQPPRSAIGGDSGPLGGGWKGVRLWCQQESSVGGRSLRVVLQNHDLVVVHVDADVAKEHDSGVSLAEGACCPPPSVFTDPVRSAVLAWLDVSRAPAGLVLCVPAMATETWALVALFPESLAARDTSACIECDEHIKQKLRKLGKDLDPKLVTSRSGRLKNQARGFESVAARITEGWPGVLSTCSEAARLGADLERHIQPPAVLARRAPGRTRRWRHWRRRRSRARARLAVTSRFVSSP